MAALAPRPATDTTHTSATSAAVEGRREPQSQNDVERFEAIKVGAGFAAWHFHGIRYIDHAILT